MDRRTKWALGSTVIYLAIITAVVAFKFREFLELPLNSLGDFLAGAFGPLALGWVVFGYFQQGDELRNGTAALKLQGDELRNSVLQQQRLAEISLETLNLEREQRASQEKKYRNSLRPILALEDVYPTHQNGMYIALCKLFNDGAQIHSVEVSTLKGVDKKFGGNHRTVDKGTSVNVHVIWDPNKDGELFVDISYQEQDSTARVTRFKAVSSGELGMIAFLKEGEF